MTTQPATTIELIDELNRVLAQLRDYHHAVTVSKFDGPAGRGVLIVIDKVTAGNGVVIGVCK